MATLVVLAAGVGSRFGGTKQITPVVADGRCILDFSFYDARKAGFDKAVVVVGQEKTQLFAKAVGNRLAKILPITYVEQLDPPNAFGRQKPLGTGHAICCCYPVVKEPFAVINADDYYGPDAYVAVFEHLQRAQKGQHALVTYQLVNTLSPNGAVSRAVCDVQKGKLVSLTEITHIHPDGSCHHGDKLLHLCPDTPVSMNVWGFMPDVFDACKRVLADFLLTANLRRDELYVADIVTQAIADGATVSAYHTQSKWWGITYRQDLQTVSQALQALVDSGRYS